MSVLNIGQAITAIIVIVLILLQQRGSDAGTLFGGGGGAGFYQRRRGIEKAIFIATIIFVAIFAILSAAHLFL